MKTGYSFKTTYFYLKEKTMLIEDLRQNVAEIRKDIIQKRYSRYSIFASADKAKARMERIWDDSRTFEDNAMAIYDEFYKRNKDLRWRIANQAEKMFIRGRRMKPRVRHEMMRSIYQSCDQANKRCCGRNIELFISFFLEKAGIKNTVGQDRHDLVLYPRTRSYITSVKHTVREKSNDNEYPVKVVWGYPNNPYGGFTRQGFENWTKNPNHIRIVVDPEGRAGAQNYANILGIHTDILSLDEGIEAIKRLV